MKKEQKTAVVKELTEQLKGADAIFAVDYRGISVPQAAELRSGLRDADARFRVVKNRLTLRAAEAAGTDEIKNHLTGPTALTLVAGDVALAAKTISRLGSEWQLLEYKGGIMDGAPLDADSFLAIAKLPGREQLNAQFAGIVASPITGLVRGLGSMLGGLARQLQQMADQGLVTGEAPPAEQAPAEEAPAAEAPAEDAPAEDAPAAEAPADEESAPDPEPSDSPEEARSDEEAPEGEDAGETAGAEQTGEGDAEIGQAQEAATEGGADEGGESGADDAAQETSEDSDENKEDGE